MMKCAPYICLVILCFVAFIFSQEIPPVGECTGYEDCEPKVCDTPLQRCVGCTAFPEQCPGFCNEETDKCEACTVDEQCDDDERCVGGECKNVVDLAAKCGYGKNHAFVKYECCAPDEKYYNSITDTCPADKKCIAHKCMRRCPIGMNPQKGFCKADLIFNLTNIIIVASFGFIAIMWMLGAATAHTRLQHWAKTQLGQAIASLFIVLFYFLLVAALDDWIGPSLTNTSLIFPWKSVNRGANWNWTTLQDHALQYVRSRENDVRSVIRGITDVNMIGGALTSLMLSIRIEHIGGVTITPLAAFASLLRFFDWAMGGLILIVAQLVVQREILTIGRDVVFPYLFPIGILFRTFPFTRKVGGAIIAISIGFGIILPVAYIIIEDIAFDWWDKVGGRPELTIPINQFSGRTGDVDQLVNLLRSGFAVPRGDLTKIVTLVALEMLILPVSAYIITLHIVMRIGELFGAEMRLDTLTRIV